MAITHHDHSPAKADTPSARLTNSLADLALAAECLGDLSEAFGQVTQIVRQAARPYPDIVALSVALQQHADQLAGSFAELSHEVMRFSHHYEDGLAQAPAPADTLAESPPRR